MKKTTKSLLMNYLTKDIGKKSYKNLKEKKNIKVAYITIALEKVLGLETILDCNEKENTIFSPKEAEQLKIEIKNIKSIFLNLLHRSFAEDVRIPDDNKDYIPFLKALKEKHNL